MKHGVQYHKPIERIYTTEHAPTLKAFHHDRSFVRGIMGPLGSGKSTACSVELLTIAQEQRPAPDGIRYTRFAIIRNSYPELKTTTIKTWGDWCPPQFGKLVWTSPIKHHVKTKDLDMEVLFLALDRPEDQKKLLSLELTAAWINEAREIPKAILDALTGRVGRYPSVSLGGCSWSGIIMDTNPCDDQCWWYKCAEEPEEQLSGDEALDGWKFFKQPSGISPEAENIPNLPKNYYQRIMKQKTDDWVNVYVKGEYGYVVEGKPVYPMYRDHVHAAKERIRPIPHFPLFIGVDFGLHPVAVICQKLVNGRWLVLDEFISDDPEAERSITGVKNFATALSHYLAEEYAGFDIAAGFGDPAGEHKGYENRSAFDFMNEFCVLDPDNLDLKWIPAPCPDNDITIRLEVVMGALNRLVDGEPGILVSPKAKVLRKGFVSGYCRKFILSGDGTQTHDAPSKNRYSHPHDALQYVFLGAGEYNVVLRKTTRSSAKGEAPKIAAGMDYNLFTHK